MMSRRKSTALFVLICGGAIVLGGCGYAEKSNMDSSAPSATGAQALESAQSYVDIGNYSQEGLKKQLSYEGDFSQEDIDYAVSHVEVDYEQEARDSAFHLQEMGIQYSMIPKQLEHQMFPRTIIRTVIKENAQQNLDPNTVLPS